MSRTPARSPTRIGPLSHSALRLLAQLVSPMQNPTGRFPNRRIFLASPGLFLQDREVV
jgi:hypothetical protein